METNNRNYTGTNKRSMTAFQAECGNADLNLIPSKTKKYQGTETPVLFFSCGGHRGYITKKVAEGFNNAPDKAGFLKSCLAVDHQVTDQNGNPVTLVCIEQDSPNAVFTLKF